MAYVQPNSTFQLFKGINLDNRYLHTIYFANEAAQDTWFSSKVTSALTFSNMLYRRYTSQAVKIDIDTTSLLGVTYMRFKNTRTANKWFYAFVLGVDYINENTSVVYYEIDVMQTWFIQNGSIRPCMVRREHTNADTLFANLEEEPVGSETYECEAITNCNSIDEGATGVFSSYSVVMNTTGQPNAGANYIGGIYVGTKYGSHICDGTNDAGDVDNMIGAIVGDWSAGMQNEDIVDLFSMPTLFAVNTVATPVTKTVTMPSTIGGYSPKNKKLFNYPYNYLLGTTHNGSSKNYKWELFPKASYSKTFKLMGTPIGGGQIICYPYSYAGIANNFNEGLQMSDFPKNSYAFDAYEAWVAAGGSTKLENAEAIKNLRNVSQAVKTTGEMIGGVTQIVSGGVIAGAGFASGNALAVAGGAGTLARGATTVISAPLDAKADITEANNKIAYQWKDARYVPNEVAGKSMPSVMCGSRSLNFYFYNCHVALSEITRIDDFFSCFGYAENKVKQPNLTGRQYWNFVQTEGAIIDGNMPASSKEAIGRIFDGGITFWHNGDNIGNYAQSTSGGSINNPIVS